MLPFGKKDQGQNNTASSHTPQLAMLISAGKVKCAIYELDDHTVHILGIGEKAFAQDGKEEHLEYKLLEIAAADAIDAAVQVAEVDVQTCIFGVPQSWLNDSDLKEEYNEHIEKLSRALDIEGVAFVSVPHAIAYYLQYEHKVQPTTYLVGCTREGASIAYVEKGRVLQTHRIAWKSSKVGEQIAEGLALFHIDGEMPSTMYLYGIGDLSSARFELQQHNWDLRGEKPAFVTKPEIILLQGTIDIHALSLVGAKDFAKQHGVTGRLTLDKPIVIENPQPIVNPVGVQAQTPTPEQDTPPEDPATQKLDAPENTPNDEQDKIEQAFAELQSVNPVVSASAAAAPLGFVVNGDVREVGESKMTAIKTPTAIPAQPLSTETSELADEDTYLETTPQHTAEPEHVLSPDDGEEDKVYSDNSKLRNPFSKKAVFTTLGIIFLLFGLASAGALYAYYNFPTAEVTVFVRPRTIDKNIEITATEGATVSSTNNTVPLQKIEVEIKEASTIAATGTKKIGESAKGTVILYNKTTNERQISKGTSLKVNSVEFTTDADVTIASASASIQGQTNGRSEINVTAKSIGVAGNIKKGVTLSVGSLARTEVEAEAKEDFSGGSEEDVKVIAAKDLTALAGTLREQATARESDAFNDKLASGEIRFPEAFSKGRETLTYNKKSGDEASELQGEISYTISSYAVRESDISELLKAVADQSIPQGFEKLDGGEEKLNTSFVAFSNNRLTFRAVSSIKIAPVIDTEAMKADLVGKKEGAARETILKNPDIFDVGFTYNVTLPDPILALPHKAESITIKRELRETNI